MKRNTPAEKKIRKREIIYISYFCSSNFVQVKPAKLIAAESVRERERERGER